MDKTFRDFMTRRYAEAEEFASGVTRDEEDIAADAWDTATTVEQAASAAEIARLRKALEEIAYSGRTKAGMKETARAALFKPQALDDSAFAAIVKRYEDAGDHANAEIIRQQWEAAKRARLTPNSEVIGGGTPSA